MSDLFVKTQAEFNRSQGDFLQRELAACARNAELASTMARGGSDKLVERAIADAQSGYAGLVRLMADPQQSRRLTIKAKQELTGKMTALRQRLEEVQRRLDELQRSRA
jgi:hypothetical protein